MQSAFVSTQLKQTLLFSSLLWLGASIVHPTTIANFNFRHFTDDEGLTISISRSSPPLAVLEDEHLAVVRTEPINEPRISLHTNFISAGTQSAWPRLSHFAKNFEHKQRLAEYVRLARSKGHQRMATHALKKTTAVGQLAKLVQFIPATPRAPQLYAVTSLASAPGRGRNAVPQTKTIRENVEMPLTAPSVERGLPRGEDAAPIAVPTEHISRNQALPQIWAPVADDQIAAAPTQARRPDSMMAPPIAAYGTSLIAASVLAQSKATNNFLAIDDMGQGGPKIQAPPLLPQQPKRVQDQNTASRTDNRQIKTDSLAYQAPPVLSTPDEAAPPADKFVISGEVELSGGLAITGSSTKLDIQWMAGNQSRAVNVDYSSGQFSVNVPQLKLGKIIAKLSDASGRVLGRGEFDIDDQEQGFNQSSMTGIKLLVQAEQTLIKGQAVSAYSVGDMIVPSAAAEIYGPSGVRDLADKQGNFTLSGLSSDSTLLLDGYAPDHWGTRVLASGNRRMKVPLFSNKMIQSFLDLVGASAGQSDLGIIWGEVRHKGQSAAGVAVSLSTTEAVGPIYFNELRLPDQNLNTTSTNGLYAFVKVKPGLHVVMAEHNKNELPSTVVSVSPSMVSYSELDFKSLNIQGKAVDGVAQQAVPAQISVIGASNTTRSTSDGFKLKIPSSDPVIFIQATSGQDYYVTREGIQRSEAKNISVPLYKKKWVADELKRVDSKMTDNKGLIMGVIRGPAFHVQIDESGDPQLASDATIQNVYYFNESGQIDMSLIDGLPGIGAFMLTNVKPGLHTLTITSADGEMITSRLMVSEAGVVNVINLALRP